MTHNTKEGRILSLLRRDKKASEVLFHHRYPTSTANVRNACHPFSTKDFYENNSYVFVHNGVLYNDDLLKKEHDELGIKYVSLQESGRFNDSEALMWDITRFIEGQVSEVKARGNIAFICIQRGKDGEQKALYFGRNEGNPLKMKLTKDSITLSSEGEGEMLTADTLYRFDYETSELTEQYVEFPEFGSIRYYGGYSGYSTGKYGNYELEDDEDGMYRLPSKGISATELLYNSDFSLQDALDLGEAQLEEYKQRYTQLEVKELADTITDNELLEMYELEDEIHVLIQAMQDLEKEVERESTLKVFREPKDVSQSVRALATKLGEQTKARYT